MKTRIALIAMLVLGSAAGADEVDAVQRAEIVADANREAAEATRDAARATRDAALVASEAARVRADALRLALSPLDRVRGTVVRTETTVVAPRRARLELESYGGDIVVTGWDRDLVRLVADHKPGTRVTVTVQPAAIVVDALREVRVHETEPGRHGRTRTITVPVRVDYHLNVPRGMNLRLSGMDSEIRVEGVQAEVSAETVNGAVRVRGGRGTVRAESINSGVEIVGARGLIEAGSVNEDVVVHDVEGRVRAETVRGNLELLRVLSDAVEASTVSGDLRYEGSIRPGGEYDFESHSGAVTVVLPARPDATVKIETFDGSFQSSFPVPVKQSRLGEDIEFVLGDGRAELTLASFSGAIRLLRAGEAPKPPAQPARVRKPAAPAAPKTR